MGPLRVRQDERHPIPLRAPARRRADVATTLAGERAEQPLRSIPDEGQVESCSKCERFSGACPRVREHALAARVDRSSRKR